MKIASRNRAAKPCESARLALAAVLLAAISCTSRALADDPPSVRRVFVPADRVSELGTQFPELRSLARDEFDELLRRAHANDPPVLPLIETARYEARLDGDTIVGAAELAVRGRRATRSLLRWPASAWQISRAKWDANDAAVGYIGGSELGLIVPAGEPHKLTFSWSAAARMTEGGRRFDFEVPPSLLADLSLDLPPGLVPSAPGAEVRGPTDAPRPVLKRWSMRWSPAAAVQLLLSPGDGPRLPAALIAYDREMSADVAEDGTHLVARFNLTVAHQAIGRIEFDHSPGLKIYSWSGATVYDWEARDDKLVLELAEPLAGSAQFVLRAIAAGPSQAGWQLPRLEIAGGHWTGGTTYVRAADGVHLYDVRATRGHVTARQGAEPARPEFAVEHAVPDPQLAARVSLAVPQVFARVHSTLQLAPRPQLSAAVRWQVGSGEIGALRVRVTPGWSVETVEAAPGVLARWTLERDDERGSLVHLRLNRPQAEDAVVQAQVLLRGPDIDAALRDAVMPLPRVSPLDVHVQEETIAVEQSTAWSFDVEPVAGLTLVLRVTGIGPGAGSPATAATYRFDGAEAAGRIVLRRPAPEVTCDVAAAVELDGDAIRVNYVIDVDASTDQADPLELAFSAAAREHLSWELPAGVRVEPVVETGPLPGAEVWRVVISRAAGRRTRLAANWQTALGESIDVPLPALVGSTATTGDVSISVPAALAVTANVDGLARVVVSPGTDDLARTTAAWPEQSWRYEKPAPRLRLDVRKNPAAVAPESWITRTNVETELNADGGAIHRIRYDVVGPIGMEFTIEPPAGVRVRSAHSPDGLLARQQSGVLRAVHSATGSPWRVAIEYSEPPGPLGTWARLEFRLPRVSLPSLRTSWQLRGPSGHTPVHWPSELTAVPPHAANSAIARVFGPLVRRADEAPFRFWTAEAWQVWWTDRTRSQEDPLEHQLSDAISEFLNEARPRERTWARLLDHIDLALGHRLLVDSAALDTDKLDLNATVHIVDDATPDALQAGKSTLAERVIRTRRGLLVTSRDEADVIGEVLPGKWLRRLIDRGGLLEAADRALLDGVDATGRFVLFHRWVSRSPEPARSQIRAESLGRDVWRFEATADLPVLSVTLVPTLLVKQVTASVVVLTVILAFTLRPGGARWRVGLLGVLSGGGFALALMLPDALSPPAAALAWSQFALAMIVARRRRGNGRDAERSASARLPSTLSHAATGAIILVALLTPRLLRGATQSERTQPALDPIVFIPFDPEHPESRHEATRVLVPRALHDSLVRAAASAADVDRLVLIRSASYLATVREDAANLAIDFEVQSFAGDESVRGMLPLTGLLLRQAQLDGEPCALRQEQAGFSFEIVGAGVHRLHLEGTLAADSVHRQRAIDQPIPPVPSATVTVEYPLGVKIELDGVVGTPDSHESPDGGRIRAELGAVSRLRLRWGRELAVPPVVRVDAAHLWSWFGGVPQLHARLHAAAEAGPLARLVLEPDPRLILTRVQAPGLARYWLRAGANSPQLVLEFDAPQSAPVSVDLGFILSGAGEVRNDLPDVRCPQGQMRVKLLAIRSDGADSINIADADGVHTVTADEFQNIWGEPLPASGGARFVRVVGNAATISVERIRLREPTRLRTQAAVRVGRGRIETSQRLTVTETAGKSFRQEFTLPPGIELSTIRSSAGTHWRAVTKDRLLWTGVVAEGATPTIDVEGWTPIPQDDFSLPLVRPADDADLFGELVLWRSRDARLAVRDARELGQAIERIDLRPPTAELVGAESFTVESADCSATLKVERVAPTLTAAVATRVTVESDDTEWVSAVEYQVAGGSIELLELRLPADFKLPLEIEGEGIRQRSVHNDGTEQVWRIHLAEPRWSSFRILLSARLPRIGGILRVPIVRPQGVAEVRNYLLIQNATERQVAVRGAAGQPAVSADAFTRWFSEPVTSSVVASIEVGDLSGPVEIHADETPELPSTPASILERHRAWLGSNGVALVESRVWLRPRSLSDATLRLPRSATVLQLHSNGRAAEPIAIDGNLVVHLASGNRPHELKFLWRWPMNVEPVGSRARRIELPRLSESACPSVWAVHAPEHLRVAAVTETTCRSAAETTQAQAIADEILRMLPLAKGVDVTERGDVLWDLERYFAATVQSARRVFKIEAEVGLPTRELHVAHDRAAAELSTLIEQHRQFLDRHGLASLHARAEAQVQRLSAVPDSLVAFQSEGAGADAAAARNRSDLESPPNGATVYLVSKDSGATIMLGRNDSRRSILPGVLVGLAGLVVVLGLTGSRAGLWFLPLALFAVGLFWCWTLRPEPVGVAFVVVAGCVTIVRIVHRRGGSGTANLATD